MNNQPINNSDFSAPHTEIPVVAPTPRADNQAANGDPFEAEFQKLKTRIHRELIDSLDLSRIDKNRDARLGAIDAGVEAARQGATNSITFARNAEKSAITGAILGFAGAGLQIGAGVEKRKFATQQAKNLRP